MTAARCSRLARAAALLALAASLATAERALGADGKIPAPESYFRFKIGADYKLARWDKIVAYLQAVAQASDRVRYRDLGKTTNGNPFVLLEIAAPATLKDLERFKRLERRLCFQDGAPTVAEREELFKDGKPSCSSPATSTRRRLAPRRWCWSWCTSSPSATSRASSASSTT